MSIFVSIASFRDRELSSTVNSLLSNADSPEEIFLGIVSQDLKEKHLDFTHIKNCKQINLHVKDARGAGYARKLAMDLYDNQDYFFQIDSHMRFAKHWDSKLKNMLLLAQNDAQTEKIILSQFPAPYFIGSDNKEHYPKNDPYLWDRPSWTKPFNTHKGVWAGLRQDMDDFSKPHKSQTVLAGYIFAPGNIVKEVPYDDRISFMGEELCFALRAYTRFWEIYAPNEMLVWHFYKRVDDPKIWKGSGFNKWMKIEKESSEIQRKVLLGLEKGDYGIGDKKRYFEYQDSIGIDFHEFYLSDKISYKENMSVLIQEIDFNDTPPKTQYCISNIHNECQEILCKCECHEREE